jgi:hypothetical protein
MKKIVFLNLIISFMIGSCTQQEVKSPIEGAWQLAMNTWVSGDTITNFAVPTSGVGSQLKMWSMKHFAFGGTYKGDTTVVDLFGGGTYTLNSGKYEEDIIYHNDKSLVNTKFKCILKIRNDTLTQQTVDINWQPIRQYLIEKYVRAE